MIHFKYGVAGAAIGLLAFGIVTAEAAGRPNALAASFSGILMDGPLAGQVAASGAIPSLATRHVKTPYGVAVCVGGNTQVNLENLRPPSGSQKRTCQWEGR